MRSRALAPVALLAVLSLAVATMVARNVRSARPAPAERPLPAARIPPLAPGPPPVDPGSVRDVFRFVGERGPLLPAPAFATASAPTLQPPPGPRLVGLVRQSGRLLAALTLGGVVALGGPGEAVAGVTILSVSEEAVRIRRSDGSESTLVLP